MLVETMDNNYLPPPLAEAAMIDAAGTGRVGVGWKRWGLHQ